MKKQLQIIGLTVAIVMVVAVFFSVIACVSILIVNAGLIYLLIIFPVLVFGWAAHSVAKYIIQNNQVER